MSTIAFMPAVSDPAAKGKAPEGKPTNLSFYFERLPTDVLNLIMPFLADPVLCDSAIPLMTLMKDKSKSLADRIKAIHYDEFHPDGSHAPQVVQKCREAMKMIGVYREMTKKEPEFLPNPKHSEAILEFLNSCDSSLAHDAIRDRIKERRFAIAASTSDFEYRDGRSYGFQNNRDSRIYHSQERDGCRLSPNFFLNYFYIYIDASPTEDASSGYDHGHDFGMFRDMVLASNGILFVAREFNLEVYDLKAFEFVKGVKKPTTKLLYKLDYQFDKITWDQERICLIGEKKGIVTELKFDSIEHKVQPEANRYSHLCAKIAYVIKRVLKIIVINGPVKAFEGTKEDINDLLSSKRTVGILFVAGVVGVGILAVGLLICSLANILFAILGSLIVAVGGILATCSAVLLRPPLFGLITSIGETLGSLDELYCEQVFS